MRDAPRFGLLHSRGIWSSTDALLQHPVYCDVLTCCSRAAADKPGAAAHAQTGLSIAGDQRCDHKPTHSCTYMRYQSCAASALQHTRSPITCMQHPAVVPTGCRCDAVPALECQSTRVALPDFSKKLSAIACGAFFAQGHQCQPSAGWHGASDPAACAGVLPAARAAVLAFLHRVYNPR